MTARSSSSRQARADEMRVRILHNAEACRVLSLNRPRSRREYDPAQFRFDHDDRRAPLAERDPRGIEFELADVRAQFWNASEAGLVRLAARHAVRLSRHLDARALESLIA